MAQRRSFTNTKASIDREVRLRREDEERQKRFEEQQNNIFKREEEKARRDAQRIQTELNARREAALKSQVAQGVVRSAREKAAEKMTDEKNRRHIEDQILEARLRLNTQEVPELDKKGSDTGKKRMRTPDEVDQIINQSFHPENLQRQLTPENVQGIQAGRYTQNQETDEQGRARVAAMRKAAGMPEATPQYLQSLPTPQPQQQVDPKVKAVQEKAQFDAGQFEKRYTNKQKQEISAGEKADQELENNPNFSAEEKAAGHQAWAQKKLSITPSYLPKLQPYKDGQKIGDTWTEDGVHKTRDADGSVKRIAKMNETNSGSQMEFKQNQEIRDQEQSKDFIEKRHQLASENLHAGLTDSDGIPLPSKHRSIDEIDEIMNNTMGLRKPPALPIPKQQQPRSNQYQDILKDAINNPHKLNDPNFAKQAWDAYQNMQQPQQPEQPAPEQQPQPQQINQPSPQTPPQYPGGENPATGFTGGWRIASESNPPPQRRSQIDELQAYKQLLEALSTEQPQENQ